MEGSLEIEADCSSGSVPRRAWCGERLAASGARKPVLMEVRAGPALATFHQPDSAGRSP